MDLLQARAIILGIAAVCAVVAVLGAAIAVGAKVAQPRRKVKASVTVTNKAAAILAVALFLSVGLYSPTECHEVYVAEGDTYYGILAEFKEKDESVNIADSISSSTGAGWYYCDRLVPGKRIIITVEHDSAVTMKLKELVREVINR